MIPLRVRLRGFLSYRDEQVLDFGDAPIVMLSGPNGSGKSSVFDAVTFALFGAHRGGRQNAEELIHKEADALLVELDLRLGDAEFRLKRTLTRRVRSTRQVHRRDGEDWVPEPGTSTDEGFRAWVRDRVGMTYETFTSSVLLAQGGAERLIAAAPSERLEVLKGIVGIERYERLHRRVEDRRKALEAQVAELRRRLDAAPEVSDDEVAAADRAVGEAEAARSEAQGEAQRLAAAEAQARRVAEWEAEAAVLRGWLARAEAALADASAIERDAARLAALRATLPHLEAAASHRAELAQAARRIAALEARRRADQSRLAVLDDEIHRHERARADLAGRIAEATRSRRAIDARLLDLAAPLARADLADRRAEEVARLDAEFAAAPDPTGPLAAARAEVGRRAEADRALGPLSRLVAARDDLDRARLRSAAARAEHDAAARVAAERAPARAEAEARVGRAAAAATAARDAATQARMRRDLAAADLLDLDRLVGEPTCRHCGQPLAEGHLDAERSRRSADLEAAELAYSAAAGAWDAAEAEVEAAEAGLRAIREEVEAAERRADAAARARAAAEADATRLAAACAVAVRDLPESLRLRVAPDVRQQADGPFPGPPDLDALRAEAASLDDARRRLAALESQDRERALLAARLDAARKDLAALVSALPAAPGDLRGEHARLAAEANGLRAAIEAWQAEDEAARSALDRRAPEREAVRSALARVERDLASEAGRREGLRAAIDRAVAALPDAWRAAGGVAAAEDLRSWREELRRLDAADPESRLRDLRDAAARIDAQSRRLDVLDAQLAATPAAARGDPAGLAVALDAARAAADRAVAAAVLAGRDRQRLDERRADRADLVARLLSADAERVACDHLARLIGPRGLQRHLVRRAERAILDFANLTLDRLSEGRWSLRLRRAPEGEADPDRALDLEALDRPSGRAIGVPFLSGSQRFRVAVSLALAIGRFASRLHRPIESVIIDEGFGCLDREGRQVMIQELQNLRLHVRRILLVSHQEEFAGAFPDGYQLELRDGTTVATPFSA